MAIPPDANAGRAHNGPSRREPYARHTSRKEPPSVQCPEIIVSRGDVYHINSGNTGTTGSEIWPDRPAVIVSNDAINEKSDFVTVVYLTTSAKRPMPYHVPVQSCGKPATAMCEQVFSVDKSRLESKLCSLTQKEMEDVGKGLQLSLATMGIGSNQAKNMFQKWIHAVEKFGLDMSGTPCGPEGGFTHV